MITEGLRAFSRALEEDRRLTHAEVAEFVYPVMERHLADGIPMPTLYAALHGASRYVWAQLHESSDLLDSAAIAAFGAQLDDLMGSISVVMAEVYQETATLGGWQRDALQRIASALLTGESLDPDLMDQAGAVISDRYDVLALSTNEPNQSRSAGDLLVARRRMRLARSIFDELGSAAVFTTFDGFNGTVLIPTAFTEPDGNATNHPTVDLLVAELHKVLEIELYAAVHSGSSLNEIPSAASETKDLVRLAQQLNRQPGLYRLPDLLFEYQATRPGPGRTFLAQLISPLIDHPGLLHALHLHVKYGADRKAAAAELYIHPNTYTYRLRRVHEITGVDPNEPHGSRLLATAFMIHVMDHPEHSAGSFPRDGSD